MHSMKKLSAQALALACGLSGLSQSASAQLVFGTTTTTTTNPCAVYLDVTSGQTTTLWNSVAQKKVNGLAADPVGRKLYANDAARLHMWDYGNVGTVPTAITGMYRGSGNTLTATGFSGLAWANGKLYGSTTAGTTTNGTFFPRGIYEIPTVPNADNRLLTTQVWAEPVIRFPLNQRAPIALL